MAHKFHKIVDKNGYEMPEHYSGRNRTYEEAQKMLNNLNKNGEHRPYKMIETQQTAVEWLSEHIKSDQNQKALSAKQWMQVIEQAKQMEKERRKEDFKIGYNQGYIDAQCNHIHDGDNLANEHEYLNQ